MTHWNLIRIADGPDGTLGVLGPVGIIGSPFLTLEEENQGNRRNVSRIPAGTYTCRRSRFYRGGYDTYEICDVPGRSRILFHIGNTEEDVEGCVAVGLGVGVLRVRDEDSGKYRVKAAVTSSKLGFDRFMGALHDADEFLLTIKDPGTA